MTGGSLARRPLIVGAAGLALSGLIGISTDSSSRAAAPARQDRASGSGGGSLELEGAPNARDLGGYRTVQSGQVRPGLLLHGPQLSNAHSFGHLEARGSPA
ncbi:tyrosine-protein phosphatase [Nocardioides sp. NPDC087217]|uniref:tyrosine-protein phosphatase n=1 Tax=Nocardioides sp. NPDC087217 TaxID=3364335 RepID=UPI00382A8885